MNNIKLITLFSLALTLFCQSTAYSQQANKTESEIDDLETEFEKSLNIERADQYLIIRLSDVRPKEVAVTTPSGKHIILYMKGDYISPQFEDYGDQEKIKFEEEQVIKIKMDELVGMDWRTGIPIVSVFGELGSYTFHFADMLETEEEYTWWVKKQLVIN